MIMRHAEKPVDGGAQGVDEQGAQNPEELVVRGWKRSGALVRLFAPAKGALPAGAPLSTPATIFASATGKHSKSLRPQHTVGELAQVLGAHATVDFTHAKGEEPALVAAVLAAKGPVLIAWEHEAIPAIVAALGGTTPASPPEWPGSRFDVVWVLDRAGAAGPWAFTQVPQLLLSGDSPDLIPQRLEVPHA
jgi:hypothetical protein